MAEDQMSEQAASRGSTSGSTVPLNFKWLTTKYIRQLAMALEIPTRPSAADILSMIERKVREDGREPLDVQVVAKEVEGGAVQLQLQDAGVLLEAHPPEEEME